MYLYLSRREFASPILACFFAVFFAAFVADMAHLDVAYGLRFFFLCHDAIRQELIPVSVSSTRSCCCMDGDHIRS